MPSSTHISPTASDAPHVPSWLIVGTAVTALLLIGSVFLDFFNTRRVSEDNRRVAHTQEVITLLEQIISLAKDAETGQRGYIIAGQDQYLEPYDMAVGEIDQQIADLKKLTADDPVQQARIPKLRDMVANRVSRLAQGIAARKSGDFKAAQDFILSGEGKRQMDELRTTVGEMIQYERGLLADREKLARRMQTTAVSTGIAAGVLTLAMFAALLIALRKHLVARTAAAFAIAEQGERWRTTLASIGDGVITTDVDGNVTHMNSVAEALTGWTSDAATGQPLTEVFKIVNEATRQSVTNPAVRALMEGVIVGLANHTVLIARDGVERPIDDSAAPIRCQDGEIVGCVLVFRDVSERSQAERALRQSEQQLRAIYDGTNEYIGLLAPDGTLLEANRASLQFIGAKRDEVVGKLYWDTPWFAHALGAPERIRRAIDAAAVGKTDVFELELVSPAGVRRWFEMSLCPILDEQHNVVLIVPEGRDITSRKDAEQDRARLAAIVSYSDDAIISKDLTGRITSWNRGAERIFAYTADEAIGQSIKMLIPTELHAEEDEILDRLMAGQYIDHFETTRLTRDGRRIEVSSSISPLKDANGVVIGASKIARDITAQKRFEQQLRQSEERFRLAADAAQAFIYEVDLDSGAAITVYGLEQLIGIRPEDTTLNREWWHARIHPDDLPRHLQILQQAIGSNKRYHDEYRILHADQNWIYVEDAGQVVRDGKNRPVRLTGSIIDITQRKEVEETLREADRRKDEFLAMLAHELRNPLAPIGNALHILTLANDREQAAQARGVIERQFNQLVRLVDDLLDMSRVNLGKIDLRREQVEVTSIIQQAIETSRPVVEESQHDLHVTMPPQPIYVNGDPQRLSQVFSNLLNNSCKYSPPRSRIWLSGERRNEIVVVTVKDSGVGIAPEKLSHIFEIFTQVDSSLERSQGGLGVGLALVQRLVEMHGGSVTAMSEGLGKGSEFVVRLPIAVEATVKPAPIKHQTKSDAKHRILVVDDNRDSARTMAMMLKLLGHTTELAHDGEEAIGAAENFRPNFVLLDIGLPKINGFEVARRIREQTWGREMFLAAMTGWGQDEDRRKSQEAGFDTHLVKPVDLATLTKLLAEQPTPMKSS